MDLWNPQTVSVQRHTVVETRDGAGGWNDTAAPLHVYDGEADFFIPRTSNEARDEANPGIETEKIRGFLFIKPISFLNGATAFLPEDRIVCNGETYKIRFVRDFGGDTVQVEAWILGSQVD